MRKPGRVSLFPKFSCRKAHIDIAAELIHTILL
jgi:hypothetical protein